MNVSREFEWNGALSDKSYHRIEVKLNLSTRDNASDPNGEERASLLNAEIFLRDLADEISHMASGVKTDE